MRGRRDNLKLFVNSAAPLDQMEAFGSVGEYFDRVIFYGWRLAGQVIDGIALETARELLRQARVESVPSRGLSPTCVYPETHAAMTGYLLQPQSESGLYGLVDVGAGTTDVAFFWLQKNDEETKAWYYAAGSQRIGMDDVDRALQNALACNGRSARLVRESLPPEQVDRHRALIAPVAKQIYVHHATILDQARNIHAIDKAWRFKGTVRYRLFVAGGGMATPPIRTKLTDASPIAPTWGQAPESLSVPMSQMAIYPDGRIGALGSACGDGEARLLLLSYGLAHRQVDIPKYGLDLEGIKLESEPDPVVDVPTGHWW